MYEKIFLIISCMFYTTSLFALSCTDLAKNLSDRSIDLINLNKTYNWQNSQWLQKNLGAAKQHTIDENKTEYQWSCDNQGSYLSVIADKAGQVISYQATYCQKWSEGSHCRDLSADAPFSNTQKTSREQQVFQEMESFPSHSQH